MSGQGEPTAVHRREEDTPLPSLRPNNLEEYVGQRQTKEQIQILLESARVRQAPLEHILLYSPPGLGKTTLAHIIAHEMGVGIKITSGPAIEKAGDLAAIVTNLKEREILFIDEIHRLHRAVEEIMYPAMEDFALDIIIGKGPSARTIRLDLPKFTLIGATTRAGQLTSPLRDRFGYTGRLEFYTQDELEKILLRAAKILEVELESAAARVIAGRSRGTPRIANRLLRRVRDFALVKDHDTITAKVAQIALDNLEVDLLGLDRVDRRLLETIIEKHGGGPVGVDTLAASISEEAETIEDVYEPFLLQIGFLQRTPRGRVVTEKAHEHLGKKFSRKESPEQAKLWS